jgi:hypothetical protein
MCCLAILPTTLFMPLETLVAALCIILLRPTTLPAQPRSHEKITPLRMHLGQQDQSYHIKSHQIQRHSHPNDIKIKAIILPNQTRDSRIITTKQICPHSSPQRTVLARDRETIRQVITLMRRKAIIDKGYQDDYRNDSHAYVKATYHQDDNPWAED